VFNGSTKEHEFQPFDEDDDPPLPYLRFLDYRYIRFCFQPVEDKFVPTGAWKDPSWTDVTALKIGLDAEERESREQVFGPNLIGIEEKSIPQILMDEVSLVTAPLTIVESLNFPRRSIRSTYSKWPVYSSGRLISITTMLRAYF
jgi:cation-transporting ATPase 13A3/4/5